MVIQVLNIWLTTETQRTRSFYSFLRDLRASVVRLVRRRMVQPTFDRYQIETLWKIC
jgi:hypothetical protein